ncbi:MAG: pro-sigmaK processing inhibitor BofA family protein [Candidatus Micrarchaeota archaeon]
MDAATGMLFLMGGIAFFLLFVLLFFALLKAMKLVFKLVINSVLGLIGIFLLGFIGINVPITIATLIVVALFGLAGLGTLLVLMFFGVALA